MQAIGTQSNSANSVLKGLSKLAYERYERDRGMRIVGAPKFGGHQRVEIGSGVFEIQKANIKSIPMALVEFIDNSYAVGPYPGFNASRVAIDYSEEDKCLTYVDNGKGFTYEHLSKSFEYAGGHNKGKKQQQQQPGKGKEEEQVRMISYFGIGMKDSIAYLSHGCITFAVGWEKETRSIQRSAIISGEVVANPEGYPSLQKFDFREYDAFKVWLEDQKKEIKDCRLELWEEFLKKGKTEAEKSIIQQSIADLKWCFRDEGQYIGEEWEDWEWDHYGVYYKKLGDMLQEFERITEHARLSNDGYYKRQQQNTQISGMMHKLYLHRHIAKQLSLKSKGQGEKKDKKGQKKNKNPTITAPLKKELYLTIGRGKTLVSASSF